MENIIEPQVPAVEPAAEVVTLSKKEADDLQFKASQSSQNFERLKDAEKEKADLEAKLALLQTPPQDAFSDEGKALQEQIDELKKARELEIEQRTLSQLTEQHSALKDKSAEFEQFRADNPGMKLETAAKAFLVENDLYTTPTRKGLERQSGGGRTPPKEGVSVEDITLLRTTNYRKYSQLVREGKIKVE